MKKVLLSALVLGLGFGATAQNDVPGLGTLGLWDDFKKADGYAKVTTETDKDDATKKAYQGIFWWQDTLTTDNGFLSRYAKNTTDGVLTYTLTQEDKAYEPFGVGFGEYKKDGNVKPFTVDLTTNAVVSFKLKNLGTETIEIKVAIQDINGKTLGFDNAFKTDEAPDGDLYKYEIGYTGTGNYGTSAAESVSIVKNTEVDFSYDYKKANSSSYVLNPDSEFGCNDKVINEATTFDYSKVKALTITVVNSAGMAGGASDCWSKQGLTNYQVSIKNLKVGTPPQGTGLFDFSSNNAFEVYPNPASSEVTFGKRLTNVAVYNAQGILVETLTSASELNVSSYKAGVYFINASEGTARVLVK